MTEILNNPDSSLPQFVFGGEYVRPITDGYSPEYPGQENIVNSVGGGPIRVRNVYYRNALTVTCTYDLSKEGYRYFRNFFETSLFNGSKRFVGRFEVTGYDLAQGDLYVARFVPGSVVDQEVRGYRNIINCQVNLEPLTVDRDLTLARISWSEAFGDYPIEAYNLFLIQTQPLERLLP